MNHCELSVVIPCLDEERTISICIEKCLSAFKRLNIAGEIVISDNQSVDNTVKIAKELGVKVVTCNEKGYGITLMTGVENAVGKYILIADADDSYDFRQIDKFYNEIIKGYDMVMGTRLNGKIHKGAMPFMHRYIGTPTLTFLTNLFWRLNISDSQCGMRMFSNEKFAKLNCVCHGMEFATEFLIKAARAEWKIREIPIEFYKDGRGRKPHLRPWRDGFRHLKLIASSKVEEFSFREISESVEI